MTPRQWATVADVAFDNRDRDAHTRAIARLLVPELHGLSPAQLLAHRGELLRQMVDVNDRLAVQNGAGRLTQSIARLLQELGPDASLEPSE